jgi:hypothetical protein
MMGRKYKLSTLLRALKGVIWHQKFMNVSTVQTNFMRLEKVIALL